MNKAEWADFFYYVRGLFKIDKKRKVEKSEGSGKCSENLNDKDSYQKNTSQNYYGRKRKKHYKE